MKDALASKFSKAVLVDLLCTMMWPRRILQWLTMSTISNMIQVGIDEETIIRMTQPEMDPETKKPILTF